MSGEGGGAGAGGVIPVSPSMGIQSDNIKMYITPYYLGVLTPYYLGVVGGANPLLFGVLTPIS